VPIDTVKRVVPELKRAGTVDRGFLGVATRTVDPSLEDLALPVDRGALVLAVEPGSPAEQAGIRGGTFIAQVDGDEVPIGGDIILRINRQAVRSSEDVSRIVEGRRGGETLTVELQRGDEKVRAEVELGSRTASGSG
jgi:S1-C subfamily serine protease